jgi:hypothetical protein
MKKKHSPCGITPRRWGFVSSLVQFQLPPGFFQDRETEFFHSRQENRAENTINWRDILPHKEKTRSLSRVKGGLKKKLSMVPVAGRHRLSTPISDRLDSRSGLDTQRSALPWKQCSLPPPPRPIPWCPPARSSTGSYARLRWRPVLPDPSPLGKFRLLAHKKRIRIG